MYNKGTLMQISKLCINVPFKNEEIAEWFAFQLYTVLAILTSVLNKSERKMFSILICWSNFNLRLNWKLRKLKIGGMHAVICKSVEDLITGKFLIEKCLKVVLLSSQKVVVFALIKGVPKYPFYFIFVLKIFNSLSWRFGHVKKPA